MTDDDWKRITIVEECGAPECDEMIRVVIGMDGKSEVQLHHHEDYDPEALRQAAVVFAGMAEVMDAAADTGFTIVPVADVPDDGGAVH